MASHTTFDASNAFLDGLQETSALLGIEVVVLDGDELDQGGAIEREADAGPGPNLVA